jgi:hypothetical protein
VFNPLKPLVFTSVPVNFYFHTVLEPENYSFTVFPVLPSRFLRKNRKAVGNRRVLENKNS